MGGDGGKVEQMLELVRELPNHFREGLKLGKEPSFQPGERIVIAGMGGSGIAASLIFDLVKEKVPLTVVKDYSLPSWVKPKDCVIALSYSGNTEETTTVFKEAKRRGCRLLAITSNGALKELAERSLIRLPLGLPPRQALGYFLGAILGVFHYAGIFPLRKEEVQEALEAVSRPGIESRAKEIVEQIGENIPLIYSSSTISSVGLRWKHSFNENSKRLAFCNELPEMNHNEVLALTQRPGGFFALFLRDAGESERVQKRFELTKEIVKEARIQAMELAFKGSSRLARVLSAIALGDFASVYLAKNFGIDPFDTSLLEKFKLEMKKKALVF